MTEQEALKLMIAPGQVRPSKPYRGGVIQIWVTRACDKSCFGCSQGSNLAGKPGFITPEQFEQACLSLSGYFGVIGCFGGNPAIHPKFEQLCDIMVKHVPFAQRGIWSNNPLGKGAIMRRTFNPAVSNINVHLDEVAYHEFKETWPECHPVGLTGDSRHSPPYVALRDVIADEGERWKLISGCDINRNWSAMVGVFRGELRAWFCEIAGAQAMLHQHEPDYPDTGMSIPVWEEPVGSDNIKAVDNTWWMQPMTAFANQVRKHCHSCGIPLRGYGELSQARDGDGLEQVSETHKDVYRPKRLDRRVQVVTERSQLGNPLPMVTQYLQNAKR